ncbi:ABC transporter ATP-binding protein [Allorhodopirellula heiligendammensis]|uniref:Daunorubicin/doxorubicin resistance ATP-binding protein DrrA n=1 Tax=Allorhodopirellula heiligendammensis TaxID=2714739 RepID=A0A5C6BFI7_9BACT|nr:ABC transporter ATP-binding protein [Allorhodopirellula heiligendammensis]TWU10955.1 Daunorubicin/doxorubicin resistance ATP-binding protein DrrA [Allorhodopirellula heiligendammensis]
MDVNPQGLPTAAVSVVGLSHRYGETHALNDLDVSVSGGEMVAVLGKNGSGKTTLFRLLSTLLPVQQGRISIAGADVSSATMAARGRLGIIFQSPSLDIKLTVLENLRCQGALYGLSGDRLRNRCDELLKQFTLEDRRDEFCQTLSGGLKRRVELAKGLLHRPPVMLLDEPSTGLDPSARLALWDALESLSAEGVAVMLTTHLMDEAAKASRVVLLEEGRKIADAPPAELQRSVGDQVLSIVADDPSIAEVYLRDELQLKPLRIGRTLRLTSEQSGSRGLSELLGPIAERLGDSVESISIGRASLEDVFVAKTGKAFVDAG